MNKIGLPPVSISDFEHRLMVRVYYEDTDAGGIVYYANYLKFAERARTEMLREIGYEHKSNKQDYNINFVVRACNIEYFRPGFLDDFLEVKTQITEIRGASIRMNHIISRGSFELVLMDLKLASVSSNGEIVRIPKTLRDQVSRLIIMKGDS